MIGVLVKIAFHNQLKKTEFALASELAKAVSEAATDFGARLKPVDESFFLGFDKDSCCARLRAAEAARRLESRLKSLSPRLHGWNIIIGTTEGDKETEELTKELRKDWYRSDWDGLIIDRRALEVFADYAQIDAESEPPRILGLSYALPGLPEGYIAPSSDRATTDLFADEVGNRVAGRVKADILLATGTGGSPARYLDEALSQLFKEEAQGFLRLRASVGEPSPYGPYIEAIVEAIPESELAMLSGPDRASIEEFTAVLDFLRTSPYRKDYTAAIKTRIRLYMSARLRLYAAIKRLEGLPPILVLEALDRFPESSLELIRGLITEGLLQDGLVLVATAVEQPSGLEGLKIRRIAAPPPPPAAVAQAALLAAKALNDSDIAPKLAAYAETDPFRLALALRLASKTGLPQKRTSTEGLAALVLSSFPPEFSELILAHSLAEDVLDEAGFEAFLLAAGFLPGVRPLLYRQLAELGFFSTTMPIRLQRREAGAAAEETAPDHGASIKRIFSEHLLALHASGKIRPSEALFRRIGRQIEKATDYSLFYLDCTAADALYGPSESTPYPEDPIFEGISAFQAAYSANDEAGALGALLLLESSSPSHGQDPLILAVGSLCKAYDEYARGAVQIAAARAKPALMGLHNLKARRTEARAHRLLGLCALAQGQIQEGADYLSNAGELAEEASDALEYILCAYSEAAALLLLGDFKRSLRKARKAAEWAAKSFRIDWESACDFLSGRIAFDLGRYAEAEESFGRIGTRARVYQNPEAEARAEIWSGRTAAYLNEGDRARGILGRRAEDAEALYFLAELAYFEGEPREAARLSAEALPRIKRPAYRSADVVCWDSGFDGLEARALGFLGDRSYLADQIGAFADFSAALGGGSELIDGIARRTREERLASLHPQAHLYHYYCYLALMVSDCPPIDAATVLSKSFKALQDRTTHIEEAGLKDEFLEKNRWNRAILAEARRHKLI